MSMASDPDPTTSAKELFEHYASVPGAFDELGGVPAGMRAHWAGFVRSLVRLGRHELASRWDNGRRILRDHGVTYNVYGDPQGMDRPWGLDLVPLIISAEDWTRTEAALIQRTRLLNLVLADIYGGGQRLLRDGFVPPELVYANPGFLRPCRGITAPKQVYLHLHACDLARSPEGRWWVLADRTQAPSGAGYALENRSVIARILPEDIRDSNIERLAGFFRVQRQMLFNLAPGGRGSPNVVLLTPGPHNETYFEHAYLARHLGFPLVEGADLTVRDRKVFLKTLEGLQPVDVILRRVDGWYCDPLELRGDSFLGVPGLVEATRAGNVTVANALGAGLLESPAFLAFLPGLCRHVLGEELLMPSVATWWCGQSRELKYVLENLDRLIIKPAFGNTGRPPWVGGRMSAAERSQLVDAIRSRPREFVAQERVILSRAPVWVDGRFEARSVVVRTYVANGGDSCAVLPGGLTRVARTLEDPVVSMQSGGGSKDTWVITHESGTRAERFAAVESRVVEGVLSGVPSRAADNLFWLGRYTERLEQTLRVMRCFIGRLSDEPAGEESAVLQALTRLLVNLGLLTSPSTEKGLREWGQHGVLDRLYKPDQPGSVRELLGRIRFITSTVRDRFSGDTWRILGRLELDSRTRPGRLPLTNASNLVNNLILDLAAFNGMEMENMTRGHGWRFLDVGRRVERGFSIVGLLRASIDVGGPPGIVLESVLEIADSVMTYRRRHYSQPRLPGVLELLLCDASNPRGLAFQLECIHEHSRALPRPATGGAVAVAVAMPSDDSRPIEEIRKLIHGLDREGMARRCLAGDAAPLERLLDDCAAGLGRFSDGLTGRYFNHTLPRVS